MLLSVEFAKFIPQRDAFNQETEKSTIIIQALQALFPQNEILDQIVAVKGNCKWRNAKIIILEDTNHNDMVQKNAMEVFVNLCSKPGDVILREGFESLKGCSEHPFLKDRIVMGWDNEKLLVECLGKKNEIKILKITREKFIEKVKNKITSKNYQSFESGKKDVDNFARMVEKIDTQIFLWNEEFLGIGIKKRNPYLGYTVNVCLNDKKYAGKRIFVMLGQGHSPYLIASLQNEKHIAFTFKPRR